MFSRFTLYFEEVVRSGSIRKASERLNIAPSAVDRHILLMEKSLGVPLFERLPQGLRPTAAGEVLISNVRRWQRELRHAKSQIDDLRGLRRGEVTIALVEGATDFLAESLIKFRKQYSGIDQTIVVAGAKSVIAQVVNGEVEIGLTFNPSPSDGVRVERAMVYQLGAVVPPNHALAGRAEVGFAECADYGLVIPDHTISLREVIDTMWRRTMGGNVRGLITANGVGMLKTMVQKGAGVGMLTAIDVAGEIAAGDLVFIPLSEHKVPLSVLSLVSAAGRALPAPASLLLQHLASCLQDQERVTAAKF